MDQDPGTVEAVIGWPASRARRPPGRALPAHTSLTRDVRNRATSIDGFTQATSTFRRERSVIVCHENLSG